MTYNDMFILGPGTVAPMSPIVLYIPLNKAIIYPYIPLYALILLFLNIVDAVDAISDRRVQSACIYAIFEVLEGVTLTPKNVTAGTVFTVC
jgi:hypothetical protein